MKNIMFSLKMKKKCLKKSICSCDFEEVLHNPKKRLKRCIVFHNAF